MVHFEIDKLKGYRGNKGVQGLYQFIINEIPPHDEYYELFLGSGEILRRKLPAAVTVGIDYDRSVINAWTEVAPSWITLSCSDALKYLPTLKDRGPEAFIYLDPTYLKTSTRSGTDIYNCNLSRPQHIKMLSRARTVKCYCMISAYKNPLYDRILHDWRQKSFNVCVHGSSGQETIYMNYPEPSELHDYQYIGTDSWDRQRIKRKIQWKIDTLKKLPILEQRAILQSLNNSLS